MKMPLFIKNEIQLFIIIYCLLVFKMSQTWFFSSYDGGWGKNITILIPQDLTLKPDVSTVKINMLGVILVSCSLHGLTK